jgi:hypothetical protein
MTGSELAAYQLAVVRELQAIVGDDLIGVYAGGSLALGDYEPGRSDLDMAAVVRRPLTRGTKAALVAALRHEALSCPARGLELVVYSERAVTTTAASADFELNLNTGAGMVFRADLQPGDETHWFPLDRSVLASHGIALLGPPAREVFAPVARGPLLEVLAKSLRWWRANQPASPDAVLNACRSLRYAATAAWASKRAAGEWAAEHGCDVELVRQALAARGTGASLDPVRVRRFLAAVGERLRSTYA